MQSPDHSRERMKTEGWREMKRDHLNCPVSSFAVSERRSERTRTCWPLPWNRKEGSLLPFTLPSGRNRKWRPGSALSLLEPLMTCCQLLELQSGERWEETDRRPTEKFYMECVASPWFQEATRVLTAKQMMFYRQWRLTLSLRQLWWRWCLVSTERCYRGGDRLLLCVGWAKKPGIKKTKRTISTDVEVLNPIQVCLNMGQAVRLIHIFYHN